MNLKTNLRLFAVAAIVLALVPSACRSQNSAAKPFTADISMSSTVIPGMTGRLYVSGNHIRLDWGKMVDVFDLKTRQGWRSFPDTKVYMLLGSRKLSTFAPEMVDGSMCPRATYPTSCKLVGSEAVEGRAAKKWDLYDPVKGFHVYYWIDDAQSVTLRMEIGDAATYNVSNIHAETVSNSMFELPKGFTKLDEQFRPMDHD